MTLADEPAQAPPAPVAPSTAPVDAGVDPGIEPEAIAAPADPVVAPAPDPRRLRLTYQPELDGIRGLGLLVVVLHHMGQVMWAGKPRWFFSGGQVGLDVFFALSGFLITALLLGEHGRTGRIRLGDFLWRRLLRLMPALAAFMVGLVLVNLVTDRYTLREMLTSAAWVLSFATGIGANEVVVEVVHTWSMSVEAHFYLMWCLVTFAVVALVKRPYAVLAGVAVVGIAVSATLRSQALTSQDGLTAFNIYVKSIYRMDAPLVGALAGIAWVAGWFNRVPPRAAGWATALSLVALGVVTLRTTPLSPILFQGLFTVVAAIGAVLVVAVQLSGPSASRRLLRLRPLVLAGTISYSVYLWHLPIMLYLNRNAQAWPLAQRMLVALVATAVAGAASYYVIERPFLRRKARARA